MDGGWYCTSLEGFKVGCSLLGGTSYLVIETIWTKSVATVGAESWGLQWSLSSLY